MVLCLLLQLPLKRTYNWHCQKHPLNSVLGAFNALVMGLKHFAFLYQHMEKMKDLHMHQQL